MELTERDVEFAVNYLQELSDNLVVSIHVVNMAGLAANAGELTVYQVAPYFRMSFCWVAISLCKVIELWERFGILATEQHKTEMKSLIREIRARGFEDARNKIAAHMFDRATKEPLMPEQVEKAVTEVMRGDMEAFFSWLHRFDDPNDTATVTSTLRRFREDIVRAYPHVRITN